MGKTRFIVADVYLVDSSTKEETRVSREMVFGRTGVDKNFPTDTLISRRHFRIVPSSDQVLIEDLASTNRTTVNGKLLKAGTLYKLRSRDLIEFGQQKLQIFIGGKICAESSELVLKDVSPEEATEASMVFERLVTGRPPPIPPKVPPPPVMPKPVAGDQIIHGVEGLDIQAVSDVRVSEKNDELLIQALTQRKNVAWYLQFEGSEFGPLSLKELKVVIKSKQFQGGALFVFAEGLAEWMPLERIQKYLDDSSAEYTATQRLGAGTPLEGKVVCRFRNVDPDRLEGKLEAVSLSSITIFLRAPLLVDTSLFDVEVEPAKASGIEPFRATVKLDKSRSLRNRHTLLLIQATPRTKMAIERYLREQ